MIRFDGSNFRNATVVSFSDEGQGYCQVEGAGHLVPFAVEDEIVFQVVEGVIVVTSVPRERPRITPSEGDKLVVELTWNEEERIVVVIKWGYQNSLTSAKNKLNAR